MAHAASRPEEWAIEVEQEDLAERLALGARQKEVDPRRSRSRYDNSGEGCRPRVHSIGLGRRRQSMPSARRIIGSISSVGGGMLPGRISISRCIT